jgi:hypothetical protein
MERAIQMIEEAIPHLPTQEERLYQGERLRLIRVAVKLPRPNTLAKLLDACFAHPGSEESDAAFAALVAALTKIHG